MSILGEFKAFIMKGNVVDLAVGVVIGAAFKSVVDSVVADLITPVATFEWDKFNAVNFGNAVGAFVILAAVVFFLVVKPMNHLMALTKKKAETQPEAAPLPEDVKLLMEIRDLLKSGQKPVPPAAL